MKLPPSFLLIFLVSHSLSAQFKLFKQPAWQSIQLDTSLTNHCNQWDPKQKGLKNKVSFGPFTMLDVDKGNTKKVARTTKENDFKFKTVTTKKTHTEEIVILYNNTDTIYADLLVLSKDQVERRTFLNKLLSKESDEEKEKKNYSPTISSFEEITLLVPGSDSLWHFLPDSTTDSFGIRPYWGHLLSGYDTITINNGGNIFKRGIKEIAAYQSYPKKHIWISNQIDKQTEMVLGAFIACYIRIYD